MYKNRVLDNINTIIHSLILEVWPDIQPKVTMRKISNIKIIKKKSPKVPDFTCFEIDKVLEYIDKVYETKKLSKFKHKLIHKKLEALRTANDCLRDSGKYWYEQYKKLHYKMINAKIDKLK